MSAHVAESWLAAYRHLLECAECRAKLVIASPKKRRKR